MAPLIESRAEAIEEHREVTPDVNEAILESGIPWMLLPAQFGGGEQGAVELFETVEELSRADGSTGWHVMANCSAIGAVSAFLPDAGLETLFGGEKKSILAGQLAPMGTGVEVDGGFVISGRYQFGSGSAYADWMAGGFVPLDDGKPRTTVDGSLDQRVGVVPKADVVMRGNWDVTGLVGTSSYDYEIVEQFVPYDLTFERLSTEPARPQPPFALGVAGLAVGGHTGVALGLARRALEETARLTKGKKRAGYPVPVDQHPVFLKGFAEHDALYHGARAHLIEVYRDAEGCVSRGEKLTPVQRARLRQAATWAHNVATQVVDFCRLWSGSPAFRNPSVLGRVIRDIDVATQHALLDQITLVDAGTPILECWREA